MSMFRRVFPIVVCLALGCGDSLNEPQEPNARRLDAEGESVSGSGEAKGVPNGGNAPRIDASNPKALSASVAQVFGSLDEKQRKRLDQAFDRIVTEEEAYALQAQIIKGRLPDMTFMYQRVHGMTAQEIIDHADRLEAEMKARYQARSETGTPSASATGSK